jgi:hypothetical protein
MRLLSSVLALALFGLTACSRDAAQATAPDTTVAAAEVATPEMAPGNDCSGIDATVYGTYDRGGGSWVGEMAVSFQGGEVERPDVVVRNTGADFQALLAGRPWRGSEVHTVTFNETDGFKIFMNFVAVPGSTPFLYQLSETGEIGQGTGRFEGVSGHVNLHGPFIIPLSSVPAPLTIDAMKGWICW